MTSNQAIVPERQPFSPLKDFIAGTAAGFACKLVEYPFDTVKVLLQTQTKGEFKGVVHCIKDVVATHGFVGLYRGLLTPLVGSMAENAVLFSSYGTAQRVITGLRGESSSSEFGGREISLSSYAMSGAFAGLAVSHVLTPVELVKCRLQIQNTPGQSQLYTGPMDCIRQTIKADGFLRGLYKGHTATMMREVPGNMAWFGVYEYLCKLLTPDGCTKDDLPGYLTALAGGCSGMAYWTAFFPADVVKSRLQTDAALSGKSFGDVFFHLFRTEGFKALYKGWGITVARAMPSNAVLFVTYEFVAKQLR